MADRIFTKSVIPFKKAALSKEEYALLIAILFSKSSKINKNFKEIYLIFYKAIEGLSYNGRELLYEQSVKYMRILLEYQQNKYGVIEGARRLDECIRLINISFQIDTAFREMHTYLHFKAEKKSHDLIERYLDNTL